MTETYVTGANGFVGKHLMAKLPGAEPIPHALTQMPLVSRTFFLSTYGNLHEHNDRSQMILANVADAYRMLKVTKDFFVYFSSSSVTLPVQTPYSRTKRAGEEIVLASGVPAAIIRPFSITGCGEQPQHLIPTLIRSCMTGQSMPFVPSAVHDFIDVEDLVTEVLDIADGKTPAIFEIGSGVPYTNDQVKMIVEDVCGKPANVLIVPSLRKYDNKDWFCKSGSPTRPSKSLFTSVKEMVEAYKKDEIRSDIQS